MGSGYALYNIYNDNRFLKTFIVTLNYNSTTGVYTVNQTLGDILTAIQQGKCVNLIDATDSVSIPNFPDSGQAIIAPLSYRDNESSGSKKCYFCAPGVMGYDVVYTITSSSVSVNVYQKDTTKVQIVRW